MQRIDCINTKKLHLVLARQKKMLTLFQFILSRSHCATFILLQVRQFQIEDEDDKG